MRSPEIEAHFRLAFGRVARCGGQLRDRGTKDDDVQRVPPPLCAPFTRQDNDYCCGINSKSSTRFDRNFGISDWVTINLGTRLGLPLVSYDAGSHVSPEQPSSRTRWASSGFKNEEVLRLQTCLDALSCLVDWWAIAIVRRRGERINLALNSVSS